MIKSQYILDIFDLAFDDHSAGNILRKQIPFLSVTDIDHRGIGAFVHFQADSQIQQFKIDTRNATSFDREGNPIEMVDGVEIRNQDLLILADAIVHLKSGLIDHIEIWNKCGEDYVQAEPKHYELRQIWLEEDKRRTIIR